MIRRDPSIISLFCNCGALDEIKPPMPSHVACWNCRTKASMKVWRPRNPPPVGAGYVAG